MKSSNGVQPARSWCSWASPEERLLLLCARLDLRRDQQEELSALLATPLRWEQVLYKASWHKLSALLFRHLGHCRDRVPAEALEQLKAIYLANVAKNLYFQAELRRAIVALTAQEIPAIVLKGAALVPIVYGDMGLRPMVDLDLLVPPEDADAADQIIRRMGYAPMVDNRTQEEMRAGGRQLAALVGVGKPVTVEIHSHIVEVDSPLRFNINGFWERAPELDIGGVRALGLGSEDLLTHLSINFLKDRRYYSYSALGQLCDIAEVTRSLADQIDWDALTAELAGTNCASPVYCGLYLARHALDAPVPDRVLRALEPSGFHPRDMERFFRQRVLGDRWAAKALVAPGTPYRWWTIPAVVFRRVFPTRQSLAEGHKVPVQSRRIYYLYLQRLGEAICIAARFTIKPWEMREDFAVDRWLHAMYGEQKNGRDGRA